MERDTVEGYCVPNNVYEMLRKLEPGQAAVVYRLGPDQGWVIATTGVFDALQMRRHAVTGQNNLEPGVLVFIPLMEDIG